MILLNKKVRFGAQHLVVFYNIFMNLSSKILIISLLLLSSSCRWFSDAALPFISFAQTNVPDGTPSFRRGFKDGCTTGQYSRGNQFYRGYSSYRYDPKMIGNAEYRFGHQRGYSVCFVKFAGTAEGPNISFDRMLNPGGYDPTFNAQDINTTWGGAFNGLNDSLKGSAGSGVNGIFEMWSGGTGGGAFSANPLWAGGSKGQIFGQ